MSWKYTDASRRIAYQTNPDGSTQSMLATDVELKDGDVILEPDPAFKSQDDLDNEAARAYAKLSALKRMTPAQVQAWVQANVTNLASAQDAIATLAIAVSILSRRI